MVRETATEVDQAAAQWAARVDRGLSPVEEAEFEAWRRGDVRRLGAYGRMRAVALQTEGAAALGPDYLPARFQGEGVAAGDSDDTPTHFETEAPAHFQTEAEAAALGSDYAHTHFETEASTPAHTGSAEHQAPSGGQRAGVGPRASRRTHRWASYATAAVVLVAVGWFGYEALRTTQPYETHKGEIRQVALEDGSVVTLNTATTIEVRFDKQHREIHLDQGEALFDVAHDKQRPFVVYAGSTLVRALGTSFTVSRLGNEPVRVLVREGAVEVSRPTDTATTAPVRLTANSRAMARAETSTTTDLPPIVVDPIPVLEIRREMAWREGRLSFEGQPLRQAVAQFERYSDIKIVVDPALADEEIAGLFQANDPVGFARAIALSLNAHIEIANGVVHIHH